MDTEKVEKIITEADHVLALLYRYEMHAFALVVLGVVLCLHGVKDIGFAIVTAGTTVFKGKFGG